MDFIPGHHGVFRKQARFAIDDAGAEVIFVEENLQADGFEAGGFAAERLFAFDWARQRHRLRIEQGRHADGFGFHQNGLRRWRRRILRESKTGGEQDEEQDRFHETKLVGSGMTNSCSFPEMDAGTMALTMMSFSS